VLREFPSRDACVDRTSGALGPIENHQLAGAPVGLLLIVQRRTDGGAREDRRIPLSRRRVTGVSKGGYDMVSAPIRKTVASPTKAPSVGASEWNVADGDLAGMQRAASQGQAKDGQGCRMVHAGS
jgi:hypothetical protein